MRYARSARRHILLTSVLGLLTAVLVIAQAFLISRAVSPVIGGTASLRDVEELVAVLVVVVVLRGITVALREAWGRRAAEGTIRELRGALVVKSENLGPRWRARHGADTATLITRGLDDLEPYFVKFLPQMILVLTVTPLTLATILLQDFWSALIALLTIPLIPIFMILIGRFTEESSRKKLLSMERLGSQLLDLMSGLPTLRGLGRTDGPRAHLRRLGRQNTRTTMATLRVAFLSGGVLEFLTTLSVALVAVEVGMRLVYGHLTLATGLVIIMLAPEVFEPLRQVGAQFHASADGVAAASAAFDILDTPEPSHGSVAAPDIAAADLVLDDVWVAARGAWAPASLSAVVLPGTLTALRGPSGSGKTTTAMVLLGLEPATRGHVRICSHVASSDRPAGQHVETRAVDLVEVDPTSWWRQVTWVPQTPTLVPGTLRANLPDEVTPADLDRAAAATGFDRVLADLPHGWESTIGRGGVGLSVGQRQRLALTRALLDDSRLVVLDEPTAHLDAMSEAAVVASLIDLRNQGRTVVVIAHRTAVVAAADQVIDVRSRAATPEEEQVWPELAHVDQLADTSVRSPGFLDPDDLDDGRTESALGSSTGVGV